MKNIEAIAVGDLVEYQNAGLGLTRGTVVRIEPGNHGPTADVRVDDMFTAPFCPIAGLRKVAA